MRTFLALFAIFSAVILLHADDIVEKNGICVKEIKELEICLKDIEKAEGLFKMWTRKWIHFSILDPKNEVLLCKNLMEKMNECIKGNPSSPKA